MRINKIEIENFRCYEKVELDLQPEYTLFTGKGKTALLDALAVGLGAFVSNFDGLASYGFHKEDAHCKLPQEGSFPISVAIEAFVDKEEKTWKRSLKHEKARTTKAGCKEAVAYANVLIAEVKKGKREVILPMIAYYKSSRSWMETREEDKQKKREEFSRSKAYIDCLDAASSETRMLKWFEQMTYIELQEKKEIPELAVVREALVASYQQLNDTVNSVHFVFDVKKEELELEALPLREYSKEIKNTFFMIADIAYRMAVLNPDLANNILLETPGIVLIDDIELHLSPKWQSKIIGVLRSIFPKIQFVFTTESKIILENV